VRHRWSGGEVGRGEKVVVYDKPLLPVPEIRNVGSVERTSTPAGVEERGDVKLFGVSPRYTEDQLKYYFADDLRTDEEGFYEVRIDSRDGKTQRKRYTVVRTPDRRPDYFEWVLTLRKQDADRSRTV